MYPEIKDFDLLKALNQGLIPSHYLKNYPQKAFQAYVQDYLKEEIQAEGLVRNLRAFSHFLDSLGYNYGGLVNYSNIARDVGVDANTVKEYYQILIDTLLGYYLEPFKKRGSRKELISTPKFYFFDVGVFNYLAKNVILELKGALAGQAFEHYILMELKAYSDLKEKELSIEFWRNKHGDEVDFVINKGEIIIETKIQTRFSRSDYKGMIRFMEENKVKNAIIVCPVSAKRCVTVEGHIIEIWPWEGFLQKLWGNDLI